MVTDDIADRVIDMIQSEIGCSRRILKLDADIVRDIKVDGLDAENLLLRLGREFGVNLSGLEFDRHFGPEGAFNPFALLLPGWWRWQRERIPVTVERLIEAARTKA
jgi:acyl carrier protein